MSVALPPLAGRWLPSSPELLAGLRADWPPRGGTAEAGYLERDLTAFQPLDVLLLGGPVGSTHGGDRVVAVVADASGALAALPCVRDGSTWSVAGAGDGVAAALLASLKATPSESRADARGFVLQRLADVDVDGPKERSLAVDQTNVSVVVGEAVLVKWRTSIESDGLRAVTLRRHLQAAGFTDLPVLVGALAWRDGPAPGVVLADIDVLLPGAEDGYDHAIGALVAGVESDGGSESAPNLGSDLGPDLGALTARLHLALASPSPVIESVRAVADRAEAARWAARAHATLEEALAIEAPDRADLVARRSSLEATLATLASIDETPLIPIHGDLHLGQVVYWQGGQALIDFDGPPGHRAGPALERQPAARDVAQLLCSLDHVAVAADRRTRGRHEERLKAWALMARQRFLASYAAELVAGGQQDLLDRRLLEPFLAEQLCRELLYAAQVLPRWRYAPMGALRWRYPETAE